MAEIKKEDIGQYVPFNIWNFQAKSGKDVLRFEFPYLGDPEFIDYVEPGCGCTDAWYEDGKIKGILEIERAGTYASGTNAINKTLTVMLDPTQRYLIPGEQKRKKVNQDKPWLRLSLAGTVIIP